MQAELLDVFETISALVATLGFRVFEAIAKRNARVLSFLLRLQENTRNKTLEIQSVNLQPVS